MKPISRGVLYFFAFLMVLAAQLSFPNLLIGQFTTASLSGTVVDPSGAAIPGAKVTVQNTDTGFTQSVSAGPAGDYLFTRLPIGNYKLTVEKQGMTTYVQSGIKLDVSQAATQQVTMRLGAVSQEVTVAGDTSLVTTQSATVGQVINERQVAELPLDGRQVQQLVFLAAGVTDTTSHYCGSNCEGGTYPGEQYAKASGTFSESINYQMDGVAYNDSYINSNLPFPNPDAIQEFSVQGTNMSAEYGNAAVGGVVNVVSKSGTNQIHGDLFEFLRNGDLNARNFFAPTCTRHAQAQPEVRRAPSAAPSKRTTFSTLGRTRAREPAERARRRRHRVCTHGRRAHRQFLGPSARCASDGSREQQTCRSSGNQIPANRLSSVSQYFSQRYSTAQWPWQSDHLPWAEPAPERRPIHDQGGLRPREASDQRPVLLYQF